jgi:hypothetical protein
MAARIEADRRSLGFGLVPRRVDSMKPPMEVAVTLAPELFEKMRLEAERTGVALEWLVASLVVDTIGESQPSRVPA